jgi:hypothetical protein
VISHRRARWSVLASLAGAWLTLFQSPAYSQDYVEIDDLDLLLQQPGRLERDLDNELDDIGERFGDLQAYVSIDELFYEIMWALGDEGDTYEEEEIDLYDLELEMQEAGYQSLEDVVWQALLQADLRASRQLPFGGVFIQAQDRQTRRIVGMTLVKQYIVQGVARR